MIYYTAHTYLPSFRADGLRDAHACLPVRCSAAPTNPFLRYGMYDNGTPFISADQILQEHHVPEDDRDEKPERDAAGVGVVHRHDERRHPKKETRG